MLPQQSKTLKEQEVVGSFPSDAVILSLSHNDESQSLLLLRSIDE